MRDIHWVVHGIPAATFAIPRVSVNPANAGNQPIANSVAAAWIFAFAGMTLMTVLAVLATTTLPRATPA